MNDNLTLIASLTPFNERSSQGILLHAILFAAEKHKGQFRKGGSKVPYINHPLTVMKLLSMAGIDDEHVLAAAVLHDTVEDTNTTLEEIATLFGNGVSKMVAEVSDDKSLSKVERKKVQLEHASHISKGAKLIKIADKISNVYDTCNNPPEKWTSYEAQGYACWSKKVVEAATADNSFANKWLVAAFNKVLKEGTFLCKFTGGDSLKMPLLPDNEERCLAEYYDYLEHKH
jgi:guanosine-3',5'-bis(diphosphate) 3'-pyrophosphohydrolase